MPHARLWNRSVFCHALSTTAGTSSCRLLSPPVASGVLFSLEAGTRVLEAARQDKTPLSPTEVAHELAEHFVEVPVAGR